MQYEVHFQDQSRTKHNHISKNIEFYCASRFYIQHHYSKFGAANYLRGEVTDLWNLLVNHFGIDRIFTKSQILHPQSQTMDQSFKSRRSP